MDRAALRNKAAAIFLLAPVLLGALFFLPAGTLDYWQAWLYMGTVLVPAAFAVAYFLRKDPEFLMRRMRTREKEATQRKIIKFTTILFIIAFLVPGFDRRFGWTQVGAEISLAFDALVFLGYVLVFLSLKENSYAGRTVQVDKGQKVISTGLYSVIRHPMYLGTLIMYLATPVALGSLAAVPLFMVLIPAIVLRILNEEEVLRRDLEGYSGYCGKVRYRLLPHIW